MDLDIPSESADFLLAVIGIANTIGRVILGYISDKPWLNRLWLYNGALTVCGIGTFQLRLLFISSLKEMRNNNKFWFKYF